MKTLIPLLVFCLVATCNAELRTWTAVNGKEVEAEFVSNNDGQVSLKMKTGKIFKVPLNKLSEADQIFLRGKASNDVANHSTGDITLPLSRSKIRQMLVEAVKMDMDMESFSNNPETIFKTKDSEPFNGFMRIEVEEALMVLHVKEGKLHGPMFVLNEDAEKSVEGLFKDGKKDGTWIFWNDDGTKFMTQTHKDGQYVELRYYKDGKQDGLWQMWHKNGQKKLEGNFEDGEEVSAKYWNSKGEPVDSLEEAEK
tara:strand:- start:1514 stop:2272 length:759 start_codon:yes stop_codon:yes gene_type:complete